MRLVSLCTGYGGLDMAVRELFPDAELVAVSDIDKGAQRILAHRYPTVPNVGDFTKHDWSGFDCDILTAGFPCQPVSHAGRRKGTDDDRWLFEGILDAVGGMAARPGLLVFENVRGLLTANGGDAMARIVQGLARVGYVGRYRVLRASDVGAAHKRERVFIVAHPKGERWERVREPRGRRAGLAHGDRAPIALLPTTRASDGPKGGPNQRGSKGDLALSAAVQLLPTPSAADASGGRHNSTGHQRTLPGTVRLLPTPAVNDMGEGKTVEAWDEWRARMRAKHGNGNGHGASLAIEAQRFAGWGDYAPAIARWESVFGRQAPNPTEPTGRYGSHRLSARFVEFLMGLPDGWVTDVPGLSRAQQLKALGNGVVPQQAVAGVGSLLGQMAVAS